MSSKTAAPKVILPSVLQVAQVGQDFGGDAILVAVMEAQQKLTRFVPRQTSSPVA